MGRDIGTNVYSNNFEPQVMGLLDARTRVDTKADLTKEATWASSDGNTYAPVGIRVSVTDDSTSGNNGVYMLMSEDYAIASNWMKIGSDGNMEFVMVDLSTVNTIPGTYTPDRYLMGEFIKIQDALSIDTPFFVYQFNAEFGQFQTSAIADGSIYLQLSILYRDEIWLINFDGGNYTVAKADMGGSSVSSNVKILTTPDLLNSSRTSTINLSAADIAIIKGLSVGKDILVYNGAVGAAFAYTPLTIMNAGSGSIQIYNITLVQAGALYTFTINTTNLTTYTAGKLTKIEGSGGGDSSKLYTTTLNLGDISTRDNKAASDAERVEVDNIISKVQEGYTILSVQNDVGVNDSNSRYGIVAVTLSEDKQEIWMQVVDQWNVLTISYNKKVLGAPFYCYYLQKKTEIVELPSDASANMPYENGDYNGSNQDFANKIREISINPTNNYLLKHSPTGYYTVINPYRASTYAGFYLSTSEGESYHIYTSITTTDRSYTIQSEGAYMLKQDTLVSGKNIKTINGQSILGSGDLPISGGGSNVKFLNTPDLFSRDRQTIISLNVNDQDVIKSLYSNNYQQTPIFYVGSMTGDEGIYPISIACSSFTTTIDPYGDVVYLSTINDVGESYKISIDVIDWVASLPKQVPSSSTTTSKHDLSIDVKTYSPQGIAPKIYFRIREKVPNGRIHFVRKKRMRYFDRNDNLFQSLGYAVMEADCHHEGGVDVSTLSPNTWYEYPIIGTDLISSYPPGSSVNGKVRTHGVIRFKGATYAKSFEFKNAPFTQTQTTLHAGLQYNVLSGKKSPLFKERGEVVPIDVRLRILSTSNYNAGYEYSYVVQ